MKPLVNDKLFREELARLEAEGINEPPPEIDPGDGTYPPASGRAQAPGQLMPRAEVERLKKLVRENGFELINDGAVYRAKRQKDFMIWTLETSPLIPEERGGSEANAYWEIVTRFELES